MSSVQLYNTLERDVKPLRLINDGEVTIYSCGPTVYSYLHIGNWSSYIYWDVLVRMLKLTGYSVKWYMNITDVGHLVSDDDSGLTSRSRVLYSWTELMTQTPQLIAC
jgi:cysteinyl-tRNA synthetase